MVGLDEGSEDDIWSSTMLEPPVGLVLGAEDKGISPMIRERCDAVVSIPSAGRLSSLNVAVAGAIVMFEVARRRSESATLSGFRREAARGPEGTG
jgi:23S rRNA (guanosine2251-2'-O)-methyltransferase